MTSLTSKVLKTIAGTAAGLAIAANVYAATPKNNEAFQTKNKLGHDTVYVFKDSINYKGEALKNVWTYDPDGFGPKPAQPSDDQGFVQERYNARMDTENKDKGDAQTPPPADKDKEETQTPLTPPAGVLPQRIGYEMGATYVIGEDRKLYGVNLVTPGNWMFEGRVGSIDSETEKSVNVELENEMRFVGKREKTDRKLVSAGVGYVLQNVLGETDVPIIAFWNHEMGTKSDDEYFVKKGAVQDRETDEKAYTEDTFSVEAGVRVPNVLLEVGLEGRLGYNLDTKESSATVGLFRKF